MKGLNTENEQLYHTVKTLKEYDKIMNQLMQILFEELTRWLYFEIK